MHLRRMCILLFSDEMFSQRQLSLSGLIVSFKALVNWQIRIGIYTLLYTKSVGNKDLLCGTGQSTQ